MRAGRGRIEDARIFRDEVTLYIRAPFFLRACEFLRDEPSLKFLVFLPMSQPWIFYPSGTTV